MKKFLFIFIFLVGCANNQDEFNKNFSNLNFNKDLSLEEFKIKLEDYANNKSYPNIDD